MVQQLLVESMSRGNGATTRGGRGGHRLENTCAHGGGDFDPLSVRVSVFMPFRCGCALASPLA